MLLLPATDELVHDCSLLALDGVVHGLLLTVNDLVCGLLVSIDERVYNWLFVVDKLVQVCNYYL